MSTDDVEDLLARLSGGLAPADRAAFRRCAENALANVPECALGEGSAYRVVTSVWRDFFDPPATKGEGRWTIWDRGPRKQSRLISEGARDYSRPRRMRMVRDAEDTGT